MEGVIEHIDRRQEKGMIRGDDGLQLPFRKSALNGVEFLGLCSGQRVSYLIQEGWLGREAVNVHPVPAIKLAQTEKPMSRALFLLKIRAGEKCISLPGARVIVSSKGLFARDVRLPRGIPAVVQLCDGQHELTLFGTVRTGNADSGLAIEFKETTESMSRRLVALLVAQRS